MHILPHIPTIHVTHLPCYWVSESAILSSSFSYVTSSCVPLLHPKSPLLLLQLPSLLVLKSPTLNHASAACSTHSLARSSYTNVQVVSKYTSTVHFPAHPLHDCAPSLHAFPSAFPVLKLHIALHLCLSNHTHPNTYLFCIDPPASLDAPNHCFLLFALCKVNQHFLCVHAATHACQGDSTNNTMSSDEGLCTLIISTALHLDLLPLYTNPASN